MTKGLYQNKYFILVVIVVKVLVLEASTVLIVLPLDYTSVNVPWIGSLCG